MNLMASDKLFVSYEPYFAII